MEGGSESVFSRILATGGVAGVIAIMITGAIIYRYISYGPNEPIPEILANALTTILGFYFATSAMAIGRAIDRSKT